VLDVEPTGQRGVKDGKTEKINYYYIRLTAFFQDNLGEPAPER